MSFSVDGALTGADEGNCVADARVSEGAGGVLGLADAEESDRGGFRGSRLTVQDGHSETFLGTG